MHKGDKLSGQNCSSCNVGVLESGKGQFKVDLGNRIMLIGNVPGFVCPKCSNFQFEKTVSDQLILKAHAIFDKSNAVMFGCEYTDLVRDPKDSIEFQMFDRVRIKLDVNTWDMYDEEIVPGMEGVVVGPGENPFEYEVDFLPGGSIEDAFMASIDQRDLELLPAVKQKPKARKAVKSTSKKGSGSV